MYKIICVGKIKEDFLVKGINEYTKRISGFTKLEIIEVKEINTSDINNNINEEGNLILKKINMDLKCFRHDLNNMLHAMSGYMFIGDIGGNSLLALFSINDLLKSLNFSSVIA